MNRLGEGAAEGIFFSHDVCFCVNTSYVTLDNENPCLQPTGSAHFKTGGEVKKQDNGIYSGGIHLRGFHGRNYGVPIHPFRRCVHQLQIFQLDTGQHSVSRDDAEERETISGRIDESP